MNKKTYTKPDIFFEDFSLSTNIAAGCELFPENNAGDCGARYGRKIIFTLEITGCSTRIIEGGSGEFNNACYHNPFESCNVFFS